ncbi:MULTISPECIES: haloacid dehalogenase type II [unclassified Limnobacter]|jgi:2-haloacid dehalogenase|uniref:haloacid dehalogenase type II n=1 Tax=unclassified Limnobacter TaxID=2630203 RepID=UPI000C3E1198|nr:MULTISPECIES: haloacid dehalogenase type II [unclassified Limnobacter]MAZ09685.1 haloacid dehalogenase type II [Sutterellaceae bacterium]|tara:strand:+ start:17408 stop:18076 length:669 start_codon:yes stop_codon:yes gene_type:complete
MATPKLVLFDAYGTLFDVYSVSSTAEQIFPGQGATLSVLWRDKQIEYTRLRAMAGRYKPFWDITIDALRYACEALKLDLTEERQRRLLNVYSSLAAYPENRAVLQALKNRGIKTAILSNGNTEMLNVAVRGANFQDLLDAVLSVDSLQTFKIHSSVYQMGLNHFGVTAAETLFVSSNCWDACGATWFGLPTLWVNRAGLPLERLDVKPMAMGQNLNDVLSLV